jgi:hypothetical protein
MKKILLLLFIALSVISNAQVAITTDGSLPDNSAMLDVKSTSKGFLSPRMTALQRDAIVLPASGLQVYCLDNGQFYTNKGTPATPNWVVSSSQWSSTGADIYYSNGKVGIGFAGTPALNLQVAGRIGADYGSTIQASYLFGNGLENTGFSSPSGYTLSIITNSLERARFNASGAMGLGTASPNASAILDVSSASRGFLPPRMTFDQRNAIAAPAEGLMVFCTNGNADGSGVLSIYQGGLWKVINLSCIVPNAPANGTSVPAANQIIWNWTTMPVALGYKWNIADNYSTAIDVGALTSYTETGLACLTPYTRYVWAYNTCGHSSSAPITQTTLMVAYTPAPVASTQIAFADHIIWNWNAVAGAAGYKWSTTNNYATATDMGTATSTTESGLNCSTWYARYIWAYNACAGYSAVTTLSQLTLSTPPAPVAATQAASANQIIWNWNPVPGATGYRWNYGNEFSTAIDMGTSTSKTETGLQPNVVYTRYVWAYSCAVSVSTSLSQSIPFLVTQIYQGGRIFYVDGTGIHGLIAAPNDVQTATAAWGCQGTSIATSTAIGTGQANTTAIINGCATLGIAARICNDLVSGGFSDWYLPSRDELSQMYNNLYTNGGVNANAFNWSSSQYNSDNAWFENMSYPGMTYTLLKNDATYAAVRAIRSF